MKVVNHASGSSERSTAQRVGGSHSESEDISALALTCRQLNDASEPAMRTHRGRVRKWDVLKLWDIRAATDS